MLAATVLVDHPTSFASALPDDSSSDDGWLFSIAEEE